MVKLLILTALALASCRTPADYKFCDELEDPKCVRDYPGKPQPKVY